MGDGAKKKVKDILKELNLGDIEIKEFYKN